MSAPDYAQVRARAAAELQNTSTIMIQTLRGPAISQIDVRFRGAHMNAVSFAKVRHAIESGQVLVFHDPARERETAEFNWEYDTVLSAFDSANNFVRRSALVHEAVHIRTDMRARGTNRMMEEEFAYIVQGVYLRRSGFLLDNFTGATDRRTFPAVFSIADTLLSRDRVRPQQKTELKAAIQANPTNTRNLGWFNFHDALGPRAHRL